MKNFLLTTFDKFLGETLLIEQSQKGFRSGSDALLLSAAPQLKITETLLDVGCGVGVITLALAKRFPESPLMGIDKQNSLITLAKQNAQKNYINNVYFFPHNIESGLFLYKDTFCGFDHVVSNPPFYPNTSPKSPHEEKAQSKHLESITLKQWISFCYKMTKPRGFLYFIYPTTELSVLIHALVSHKVTAIDIFPLWSKSSGPAKRSIIRARVQVQGKTTLYPGMLIHQNNGAYTDAAKQILTEGKSLCWEIK